MSFWDERQMVLAEIFAGGTDFQHFSDLRERMSEFDDDSLQAALAWLAARGFIDVFGQPEGDISTFRIEPAGVDLVETGRSVREYVEMEAGNQYQIHQVNVNNASALNVQGNKNRIVSNQTSDPRVIQMVEVLRENGYQQQAVELEEIEKRGGFKAVVEKTADWTRRTIFSPEIISTLMLIASSSA